MAHDEGQEFVALFLFDADGHFLEARNDALGTRAEMDRERRKEIYLGRLNELGTVTFGRIEVRPFAVEQFGTTFGYSSGTAKMTTKPGGSSYTRATTWRSTSLGTAVSTTLSPKII